VRSLGSKRSPSEFLESFGEGTRAPYRKNLSSVVIKDEWYHGEDTYSTSCLMNELFEVEAVSRGPWEALFDMVMVTYPGGSAVF